MHEPLWVIGSPRSGTTLLRNLLNLHPDVALCAFESKWVPSLVLGVGDVGRLREPAVRAAAAARVRSGRMYLKGIEEGWAAPSDEQVDAALRGSSWADVIRALLDLWCEKDMGTARYWGDKTAVYIDHMDVIDGVVPHSRFVHIVRDPRDQAMSARQVWGKSVARSAQAWARRVRAARASAAARDGRYYELRFEDLLEDPAHTLDELTGWLGLERIEWPLDAIPVSDQLGGSTGLRHIDKAAATARRAQLRPAAERRIAALTGELAAGLDYRLPAVAPRPLGPAERIGYGVADRAAFARYYVRSWGWRKAGAKLRAATRERAR